MSWIVEAVTYLDELMFNNYQAYVETILGGWGQAYNSVNPGAQTIIAQHVFPVAMDHCQQAAFMWPYGVGADEYLGEIYTAFDADVMQRCFGDTINEQYDECQALQADAVMWQDEHEGLVNIIGDSFDPHSVDPSWVGGWGG